MGCWEVREYDEFGYIIGSESFDTREDAIDWLYDTVSYAESKGWSCTANDDSATCYTPDGEKREIVVTYSDFC